MCAPRDYVDLAGESPVAMRGLGSSKFTQLQMVEEGEEAAGARYRPRPFPDGATTGARTVPLDDVGLEIVELPGRLLPVTAAHVMWTLGYPEVPPSAWASAPDQAELHIISRCT